MKRLIFFTVAVIMMTICCFADETYDALYEQLGIDELVAAFPQQGSDAAEMLGLNEFSPGKVLSLEPKQLWLLTKNSFITTISDYKRELFSVIAAILISATATVCCNNEKTAVIFRLICVLTVTALLCSPVIKQMTECCDAIKSVSLFMLSYIPIYASAAAASGAVISATAYQFPVMAATQLISQLSTRFFLPLLQSCMLLTLGSSVSGNRGLSMLCSSLTRIINRFLTLAVTIFSGLLTLQSIFGHAADGASSKTAKFLVGSFVPIIGSALSDAVSAMQSSIAVIKAGLGSFGVLAITLSLLGPLVGVLSLRAVIWLSLVAAKFLPSNCAEDVLIGFSDILSIMQAILLSVFSVLLISTAIMLSFGGGNSP